MTEVILQNFPSKLYAVKDLNQGDWVMYNGKLFVRGSSIESAGDKYFALSPVGHTDGTHVTGTMLVRHILKVEVEIKSNS